MNGRFETDSDDFPFISTRGRSVVDYFCVSHDKLSSCNNFRVLSCQDINYTKRLHHLLGNHSRNPDHAFLLTKFKSSYIDRSDSNNRNTVQDKKRFNFSRIPDSIFQSESSRLDLQEIIQGIKLSRETHLVVNNTYDRLCDVILKEMNENFPCYSPNKVIKTINNCKAILE